MTVTTTSLGSARLISWDRQARRNAWDLATMNGLADLLEAAGADEAVRCVVVRGAGEHFSAGDDLFAAHESDADAWAATIEAFQRLTRVVLQLDVPVLAAIDGVCVGGALEFAASCDLRICTDRARFLTPEVTIGLVATNAGTLLLPELLGESAARELLLTGVERDADWAWRNGFVSEVVPPRKLDDRIAGWMARFDATSRPAVAATKRMLNERFGDLLASAMDRETRACLELFEEPDARAALERFRRR
jgi:enoyl-CoA hydratase